MSSGNESKISLEHAWVIVSIIDSDKNSYSNESRKREIERRTLHVPICVLKPFYPVVSSPSVRLFKLLSNDAKPSLLDCEDCFKQKASKQTKKKLAKVQLRPYTTVKFKLKSF